MNTAELIFAKPPAEGCAVLSVSPSDEGETVKVVLSVADAGEREREREPEGEKATPTRIMLHLLVEQYADLRPREGSISAEDANALISAGKLCAAVKRGMRLLEYGDRSARRLAYVLSVKGVERDVAEQAVAYLSEKGYIREDSAATSRAAQSVRKLWGPRRIREDLRANGFSPDAVEEAMNSLAEVDFAENCAAVIRKKYRTLPDDRAAKQKMVAALMRLGYDGDVIRAAARRVSDGD